MAKAKAKLNGVLSKRKRVDLLHEAEQRLVNQLTQAQHRIVALEEAICPRVAARLSMLERRMPDNPELRLQSLEQDISAINKSVAILHAAIMKDAQPADTPGSYGKGECSVPSKAKDNGIVLYMITKIKTETGLEFTPRGMAQIIRWIEKV